MERAEKLLRRGYRIPGVRDRVYIAERLQEVCEDSGRSDEARQFGEQAERLRREPLRPAARSAPAAGTTARRVKVGRNALCPCGSGKKFKKCCGSPRGEAGVTEETTAFANVRFHDHGGTQPDRFFPLARRS